MDPLHEPVQLRLPGYIDLCIYCPAEALTPAVVEQRVLPIVEAAICEPVTHTTRNAFPTPIRTSVAEEVERAWASRSQVLMLSNRLSSANHVLVNASILPRRTASGPVSRFGLLRIGIVDGAPARATLMERLVDLAEATQAHFGRADIPDSASIDPVVFPLTGQWWMKERLGRLAYLSAECARRMEIVEGRHARAASAFLLPCKDSGWLLRFNTDGELAGLANALAGERNGVRDTSTISNTPAGMAQPRSIWNDRD